MNKKVHIIGSGFSALSAACYLAKSGNKVTVYEKNSYIGGRAQQFKKDGFVFDMGPTWYWMPDVFERFFSDFGYKPQDFYSLDKLNPAYKVYFGIEDSVTISGELEEIFTVFENEEKGSSIKLKQFLEQAKSNYDVAISELVYRPGISPLELITPKTLARLHLVFSNIQSQIAKTIKNERLRNILEFPVLFLGAKPSQTPALYNFMNWADFGLGTWHPKGGMYSVVKGMVKLAEQLGVSFKLNSEIEEIHIQNKKAIGLKINGKIEFADIILSGADYHHTETLLPQEFRQYSQEYWSKKTFAPSSLLFYIGFNKKLTNVSHHTLFFDTNFEKHAQDIYDNPKWPKDPLFYASFPSISDSYFAPEEKEAGTFLIPIAPDLEDNQELRDTYLELIITRFEEVTNQNIRDHILFVKSYCVTDFKKDFNSYKGNAYGLANTLTQTAFLRPKIKSKKVHNLFFTGQLTVPGPGVPPALISGKIAAELILKN